MPCPPEAASDQYQTGNLDPVLHEVRHALSRLAEHGESTVIDLRSIPFGPGEEQSLEQRLGRGETRVEIDALGQTEALETAVAGVWIVTHRNVHDEIVGKFIEVTRIPEIVATPAGDIDDGLCEINRILETG